MGTQFELQEKLQVIKENQTKIYEKGRQDEWSDFWDILQDKGKRTNYYYAFGSDAAPAPFDDNNFKPKYSMYPVKAGRMFKSCNKITDLKGILEKQGVIMDFSNCDDVAFAFQSCQKLTRLPELDFSKSTALNGTFTYCGDLISIDKIILSDSGSTTFSNAFFGNSDLVEVRFEGVIGQNIDFVACSKLSAESLDSIIEHLKDFTAAGSGSATITLHADSKALIGEDGLAAIRAKGWVIEQ